MMETSEAINVHLLFHGSSNFTLNKAVHLKQSDTTLVNPSEYLCHPNIHLIRHSKIQNTECPRKNQNLLAKYNSPDEGSRLHYHEIITNVAVAIAKDIKVGTQPGSTLIVCDGPTTLGHGLDDCISSVSHKLDDLNIDWCKPPRFFLSGHSRGAINCRVIAHLINEKRQAALSRVEHTTTLPLTIEIFAVDPVPGPAFLHRLHSSYWNKAYLDTLPDNTREVTLLAKDEKAFGLEPLIPRNWQKLLQQKCYQLRQLPGNHTLIAGCHGYFNNRFASSVSPASRVSAKKVGDYVFNQALHHHGLKLAVALPDLTDEELQQIKALGQTTSLPFGPCYPWFERQVKIGFNGSFFTSNEVDLGELSTSFLKSQVSLTHLDDDLPKDGHELSAKAKYLMTLALSVSFLLAGLCLLPNPVGVIIVPLALIALLAVPKLAQLSQTMPVTEASGLEHVLS